MLVLKINTYSYFGENHPEGCQKEEKYYKIDKNMRVEELEKLLNDKVKSYPYESKSFEIIKLNEEFDF